MPCVNDRNVIYRQDPVNQQIARERTAQWIEDHPEQARLHGTESSRRRRARKLGNGCERYQDNHIFERDGWVCHLCSEIIDALLPRNHILGATIDHLIPISLGGADAAENVKAAHNICNSWRHNKQLDSYVAPPLDQVLASYFERKSVS
jgi:5-methylcytosine-specific restriction endonuclease McrA